MDLSEFVLARIAEDEEVARDALARASVYGEVSWMWLRSTGGSTMWEPTNHDPARVLAECEAKRRIVARKPRLSAHDDVRDVWWDVLALLALPFADHPDYDPAWRL